MPEEHETPSENLDPAATDVTGANARDGARKRRDPNEPAAVVGIGASAGGIAPLQLFFEEMKPDTGLAFVVVMHLSPDFESQLPAVLQQKTKMPVVQVTEAVKIRPNHVYVIPPNHQLTFDDDMLRLMPPQQAPGRRVTIDLFFRTLAHAFGQRAVSIILSGTDSDGVIGLKHVRAQGGVTIAQEPEEAEHDSMPVNAINSGTVDWVLRVGDMPRRLLEFVRNEHAMQLPPEIEDATAPDLKAVEAPGGETVSDETRNPQDEDAVRLVLKHVRVHTGHDFSHYKRATVLRRIARRLQVNSLASIPAYLDFLRNHPAEAGALLHDLLIGVTHFFRDQAAFAALEINVPQLLAGRTQTDELRVWVAGCATGEEAYSVTMLLCEYALKLESPPAIQVFATDIDEQAINEARNGLYPATIEADVSPERLRQFFVRDGGRYRVKKEIRDKVLFARHNVLSDPAFSRLDLVTCRNLLIYLNREAQGRVFDVFHFALRAGGLLFIGGAESADSSHSLFSPLDSHHRIYVRRSLPRPTWQIPAPPRRVSPPRFGRGEMNRPMLPDMTPAAMEAAGQHTQISTYEGQERRSVMFGELHLKLLEEYGPPSVVVNEAHNIVHLSESAGRYLSFRAGEPSTNLMSVVHPALRIELRTALFRAGQSKQPVVVPAQRLDVPEGTETIDLHVRPIKPGNAEDGFFLVLFEKRNVPLTEAQEAAERQTISREVGDQLQLLKQQLNATVEQFEASSEELKASNEELQAMNEELRSAAEQLETSKEEVQSVNEELITVNQELKEKVEELSRANSDLNNLMTSTDLATIFLDRQLRVVRFTPRVQEIFNLLPTDLGRPISDITHKLHYDTLIADAERVLERLALIEREVHTEDARTFLTRIAPYRTLDDKISGVVLTLVNVTQVKQAEAELRESEARVRTIADNVPQIIWTNDGDGNANYFNKRWLDYTGLSLEESYGGGWQAVVHAGDASASVQRWNEALAKGKVFEAEYRLRGADGDYRWFIGRNVPLREKGQVIRWFGSATDITDFKEAEAARRESEERFRLLVEGARDYAMFLLNPDNTVTYWSSGAEKIFGWSSAEAEGKGGDIIFTPEDRARGAVEEEIGTAVREGRAPDQRWHLRKDNSRLWVDGIMQRLDNPDGSLRGFAKIARDATDTYNRQEELRRAHDELEQRVRDRTRELQAMNETLEAEMAQRRSLEGEILEVTERERARISQDLHDSLCQELTATAFLLKSRAKGFKAAAPEAAEAFEEAAQTVNANAGLARDLARGLHPLEMGSSGLIPALKELCGRTNEKIACRCEVPRLLRLADESVVLNLYRIAQEAVTNARKHGKPNEIVIRLTKQEDDIILSISDDGRGFPKKNKGKGMGVHMMTYRANVSGGTLMIESKNGRGTTVTCRVPIKK